MLLAPVATAPLQPAAAFAEVGVRGIRTDAGSAAANTAVAAGGDAVVEPDGTDWIDSPEASPAPVTATELRMFALYGPREFSTFPTIGAGLRIAGETAPRGEPFDGHTDDPWLGVDKAQHLAFSFLWTLGIQYVAVNKGHLSEPQALPLSVGTSAAIGLSKEYYDLRSGPPNVFSYKDLIANGIGILLATGVILL